MFFSTSLSYFEVDYLNTNQNSIFESMQYEFETSKVFIVIKNTFLSYKES